MSSINPAATDALTSPTVTPVDGPLPSLAEALRVWLKVASLSLGGLRAPALSLAAIVAIFHFKIGMITTLLTRFDPRGMKCLPRSEER